MATVSVSQTRKTKLKENSDLIVMKNNVIFYRNFSKSIFEKKIIIPDDLIKKKIFEEQSDQLTTELYRRYDQILFEYSLLKDEYNKNVYNILSSEYDHAKKSQLDEIKKLYSSIHNEKSIIFNIFDANAFRTDSDNITKIIIVLNQYIEQHGHTIPMSIYKKMKLTYKFNETHEDMLNKNVIYGVKILRPIGENNISVDPYKSEQFEIIYNDFNGEPQIKNKCLNFFKPENKMFISNKKRDFIYDTLEENTNIYPEYWKDISKKINSNIVIFLGPKTLLAHSSYNIYNTFIQYLGVHYNKAHTINIFISCSNNETARILSYSENEADNPLISVISFEDRVGSFNNYIFACRSFQLYKAPFLIKSEIDELKYLFNNDKIDPTVYISDVLEEDKLFNSSKNQFDTIITTLQEFINNRPTKLIDVSEVNFDVIKTSFDLYLNDKLLEEQKVLEVEHSAAELPAAALATEQTSAAAALATEQTSAAAEVEPEHSAATELPGAALATEQTSAAAAATEQILATEQTSAAAALPSKKASKLAPSSEEQQLARKKKKTQKEAKEQVNEETIVSASEKINVALQAFNRANSLNEISKEKNSILTNANNECKQLKATLKELNKKKKVSTAAAAEVSVASSAVLEEPTLKEAKKDELSAAAQEEVSVASAAVLDEQTPEEAVKKAASDAQEAVKNAELEHREAKREAESAVRAAEKALREAESAVQEVLFPEYQNIIYTIYFKFQSDLDNFDDIYARIYYNETIQHFEFINSYIGFIKDIKIYNDFEKIVISKYLLLGILFKNLYKITNEPSNKQTDVKIITGLKKSKLPFLQHVQDDKLLEVYRKYVDNVYNVIKILYRKSLLELFKYINETGEQKFHFSDHYIDSVAHKELNANKFRLKYKTLLQNYISACNLCNNIDAVITTSNSSIYSVKLQTESSDVGNETHCKPWTGDIDLKNETLHFENNINLKILVEILLIKFNINDENKKLIYDELNKDIDMSIEINIYEKYWNSTINKLISNCLKYVDIDQHRVDTFKKIEQLTPKEHYYYENYDFNKKYNEFVERIEPIINWINSYAPSHGGKYLVNNIKRKSIKKNNIRKKSIKRKSITNKTKNYKF